MHSPSPDGYILIHSEQELLVSVNISGLCGEPRSRSAVQLLLCAAALLIMSISAFSAPQIEVDSADFDVGSIKEGAKEKVSHTFIVRNTGDEPLKIEKVRPG